jgi:four helix bundle protein
MTKGRLKDKGLEMFSHEKLQVYGKALGFAAKAAGLASSWDKRHAIVDHLVRASESIPLNLAEGARQRAAPGRLMLMDYAIGSSLECAACLDIADVKRLTPTEDLKSEKHRLCEITKMLIGLRKSWSEVALKEESSAAYGGEDENDLFHHERLHVYQRALELMEWFVTEGKGISTPAFRRLDETVTSLILNIAEGNGRYAELEQARFLRIADGAVVRIAVYLDLYVGKGAFSRENTASAKDKLREIHRMLLGML